MTPGPRPQARAFQLRSVADARPDVFAILPWFALFVAFLLANVWIRRDYVWIIGDDQNLMMPAINIGRGLTPNIDFVNGYPGITFYIQRAIMLVVGDQPISEHLYTAIQAAMFALVAAWMLRRRFPAVLTWILVFFVWANTYRLNPTPNPGNVMLVLVLLSLYWMDRFGSQLRQREVLVAGCLAGLAFLFKQPGIFLPVVFLLYSSYSYLAWPDSPPSPRQRAIVIGTNVAVLLAFVVVYIGVSVFGVLDNPALRQAMVFSSVVFVAPWAIAVVGLLFIPTRSSGDDGPRWSLGVAARANLLFAAAFAVVNVIGFAAIYGTPERAATALRMVLVTAPQAINSVDTKAMQPLQFWPQVPLAMLVFLAPFAIAAVRVWPFQLAILGAAFAVCVPHSLTYTDLQFTVFGTLICILFLAIFWLRRPTDRESWSRLFIFLGATCLLAYVAPHPKYHYSLGILAVSGWWMLGSAAPRRWPTALNVLGFGVVVGIAILTLQWANNEASRMPTYDVGTHTVRSTDLSFPPAVAAANASSVGDWLRNRFDYLVYLAHAP